MNGALQQVIRFFDVKAATADVTTAMDLTGIFIQFATIFIQIVGFLAISIWIARIGIDILLLTAKGTAIETKLQKFGTGKAESYENATAYIKGNLVQIALMVVLIVFLITGWIFRLFSIAMSGIGMILNRLLNLDVSAVWNEQEVIAWRDNYLSSTNAQKLEMYDDAVSSAQGYAQTLYEMKGISKDDPNRQEVERNYTNAMMQANYIQSEGGSDLAAALNKPDDYFTRHQRTDAICNDYFALSEAEAIWGSSVSCSSTSGGFNS